MKDVIMAPLTLEWYRDGNGCKNSSVSHMYDTCDRLAVLLSRATIFGYLMPSYYEVIGESNSEDTRSIYNKCDLSFLNDIRTDLLNEITSISNGEVVENDSLQFERLVGREEILVNQQNIFNVCNMMLQGNKDISQEEIESVYELFDFGIASAFFKEYAVYLLLKTTHVEGEPKSYMSLPFCVPSISRVGYKIYLHFLENHKGVLSYTQGTGIPSMLTFIYDTTIPDATTDTYMHLIGTYSLSKQTLGSHDNVLFRAVNDLFTNTHVMTTNIKKVLYSSYIRSINNLACTYSIRPLLKLIAKKASVDKCPIGKITTVMLNGISGDDTSDEVRAYLQVLLNGIITVEALSNKESDLYIEELDPTSILFSIPENVWVSTEADEDDIPEEDVEDDVPEEDPDEPGDPNEVPVEGEGEESEGEEPPPPVEVKVPKSSVLLQMVPPTKNSVDDYLYRLELHNIIRQVLANPPDNMAEEHKRLLKAFARHHLYQVSIDTLFTVVSKFIKAVPKPTKKPE